MVRDVLVAAATAGKIIHRVEAGYLLSDDHSGQKPADLLLLNWEHGRSVCVDVSIANSLQFVHENRPFVPMESLIAKVRSKFTKYNQSCADRDLILRPFVCGSLGMMSEESVTLLKQLGDSVAAATGVSREIAIADLRRRVAFAVQKAQATSWIRLGLLANNLA